MSEQVRGLMRIAVGPSLDPTESPQQAPLDNEVWMVSKQEARNVHASRASLKGGSPTWARTRDLRINSHIRKVEESCLSC